MMAHWGSLWLLLALVASMLGVGSTPTAGSWPSGAPTAIHGWASHPHSILVEPPGERASAKAPFGASSGRSNLALQKKRATDGDGAPPKGRQGSAFLPSIFPIEPCSSGDPGPMDQPRPQWTVHQGLEPEQGGQNGPPSGMANA